MITEPLIGKKAYIVYGGIKKLNVIVSEMESILEKEYQYELGVGSIKIIHSPTVLKVEVWEGDSDLHDCPWWLLTYSDFITFCNEIIEKNKELFANDTNL